MKKVNRIVRCILSLLIISGLAKQIGAFGVTMAAKGNPEINWMYRGFQFLMALTILAFGLNLIRNLCNLIIEWKNGDKVYDQMTESRLHAVRLLQRILHYMNKMVIGILVMAVGGIGLRRGLSVGSASVAAAFIVIIVVGIFLMIAFLRQIITEVRAFRAYRSDNTKQPDQPEKTAQPKMPDQPKQPEDMCFSDATHTF